MRTIALMMIILTSACGVESAAEDANARADRTHYRNPELRPEFPFSSAVVIGDTIYLSGEIGIDYETFTLVDGGAGPQTAQIFKNYAATLDAVDADLSDIVKCTVFLEDMADYAAMNEAYAAAMPDPKPARSAMGVDGLALDAALEIECLAVRGHGAAAKSQ